MLLLTRPHLPADLSAAATIVAAYLLIPCTTCRAICVTFSADLSASLSADLSATLLLVEAVDMRCFEERAVKL